MSNSLVSKSNCIGAAPPCPTKKKHTVGQEVTKKRAIKKKRGATRGWGTGNTREVPPKGAAKIESP